MQQIQVVRIVKTALESAGAFVRASVVNTIGS